MEKLIYQKLLPRVRLKQNAPEEAIFTRLGAEWDWPTSLGPATSRRQVQLAPEDCLAKRHRRFSLTTLDLLPIAEVSVDLNIQKVPYGMGLFVWRSTKGLIYILWSTNSYVGESY